MIQVTCDTMPWQFGNSYRCFREACCPNLQGLSSPETSVLVTLFQGLENPIAGTLLHASRLLLNHALSHPHALHSRKYFSHLFSSSTHLPLSFFPGCFEPMSCASTISNSVTHTVISFPPVPTYTLILPQGLLFYPEDGSKRFLWHISIFPPEYMASPFRTWHSLLFVTVHEIIARNQKLWANCIQLTSYHMQYYHGCFILLVQNLFFKDTVFTHIKCGR